MNNKILSTMCLTGALLGTQISAKERVQVKEEKNLAPILKVEDWLAMGSGCFGRLGKKDSNVSFRVERDSKDPLTYHLIFDIGAYKLDGTKPINPKNATFARECAIRVAAYPQNRWRVADVSLHSRYKISKTQGTTAEIRGKLLTGSSPLNYFEKIISSEQVMENENLDLSFIPSPEGKKHLDSIGCEQPKIVGVDLSFVNKRKDFTSKIDISPSQSNELTLSVRLKPCIKPQEESTPNV